MAVTVTPLDGRWLRRAADESDNPASTRGSPLSSTQKWHSSPEILHQHQIFAEGIHLGEEERSPVRGQVEAMPGMSIERHHAADLPVAKLRKSIAAS